MTNAKRSDDIDNTKDCCLCSQIAGDSSNDLIATQLQDKPYTRRVMLESESFAVIPSLGPLSKGHVLLCPKTHIKSFSQLDTALHNEFGYIKQALRHALSEQFGASIHLFEHGMAATGERIICSTNHAHIHFVPLPDSCDFSDIEKLPWLQFDGSLRELTQLSQNREYILYEPQNGIHRLLIAGDQGFESQYMRKLIAQALGRAEYWNWRDHPYPRSADETWRSFAL